MPTIRTLPLLRHLPLALTWALCVSSPVSAQNGVLPAGHDSGSQHVLPVWNASSGRVEALLLLSPETDAPTALDRLLPRTTAVPDLGLDLAFTGGSHLRTSLSPEINTGLALLCNQGIHLAMTLGTLGQQCLLAQVGTGEDAFLAPTRTSGIRLDTHWQSADDGLDLSFGLSWLDASLHPFDAGSGSILGVTPSASPYATLPAPLPQLPGELVQHQVYWNGALALGQQRWVSLGGTLGSAQLNTLLGAPLRWDNATVTLGVDVRGLSGRLTGRLIELPNGQGNFSGLDLGFSWRTPWQGELSFGARNLLNRSTPDTSKWPLSELPALEAPGGRTPYVRYKQDL